MGWFNHFYEGVSSVVHSIATTAKMVGDVATTIGTVASKIAPQSAHEDILAINDGPTIEVLSSNVEVVSAAIQAAADAELAAIHPGQPADFKVAKSYRIKGFTMNRKILSLKEAEDRKGNPSTNATPFMYGDMTNLLAQKGLPISARFEPVVPQRCRGQRNAEPADILDKSHMLINDMSGFPIYKIAHVSYNLKMDDTGTNNVTHSAFSHGWGLSQADIVKARQLRSKEGLDIVTPSTVPEGQLPGYRSVVKVGTRTADTTRGLTTGIQGLAAHQGWKITSLTPNGADATLTIETRDPPIDIQIFIVDWVSGRLDPTPVPVPENVHLDLCKINSAVPCLVAAA
ncbi:uncharacterized protein K444DRAFT_629210 [Hyaloscypha bicolor E]|uniref:Uncharacterized protein n=1 Tax=Hyaloscypha bicolor E TaxID=1095630 RepID=A0A2J6TCH1_9HELO|nr:uncharacterized protein K444DRAFT_629210 [Hyaloscypha bicolor E]PMD60727.1 hypothetical protein K444DRAFT_629210 [Hyaloscypha bicolor E]